MARRRTLEFYSNLRDIMDTFGDRRVSWGSDYPVLRMVLSESVRA